MTSRIDGGVGEQHGQAIDPDALAGRGRHAVLERADVVLVVVHRLLLAALLGVHLGLEPLLLIERVVQLGEGVGDLPAGDEQLEAVGDLRILVVAARQRARPRWGSG